MTKNKKLRTALANRFTAALEKLENRRGSWTCMLVLGNEDAADIRAHGLYKAALCRYGDERSGYDIPNAFGEGKKGAGRHAVQPEVFSVRIFALALARELAKDGFTAEDFQ